MVFAAFFSMFLSGVVNPAFAAADSAAGQYKEPRPSPTGNNDPAPPSNGGNDVSEDDIDASQSNSPGQSGGYGGGGASGGSTAGGSGSAEPGTSGSGVPTTSGNGGTGGSSGNGQAPERGNPASNGTGGSPQRGVAPDEAAIARVGEPEPAIISSTSDDGGSSPLAWILIGVAALAGISGFAAWKLRRA